MEATWGSERLRNSWPLVPPRKCRRAFGCKKWTARWFLRTNLCQIRLLQASSCALDHGNPTRTMRTTSGESANNQAFFATELVTATTWESTLTTKMARTERLSNTGEFKELRVIGTMSTSRVGKTPKSARAAASSSLATWFLQTLPPG